MSNRKNIKLPEELFDRLAYDNSDYQTWAGYFQENCLDD